MKRSLVPVVLAAVFASAGCASVASWEPSASSLVAPREIFGDIERLEFGKQSQVRLPARLAVADVSGYDEDRRRVETIAALAKDTSTWTDVTSVFSLSGENVRKFADLRAAAARQQSDLMLVSQRTERTVVDTNALGIFKILILPMLFLPTEEVKTTVGVRAAVVDVRNGLVYTTFDSHLERETTTTAAGAKSQGREFADALFTETAAEMREVLARKLRTIEDAR